MRNEHPFLPRLQKLLFHIFCISKNHLVNLSSVLFGAGQYGERLLYELVHRGVHVRYFMDNDPQKNNKYIQGIPCHSLEFFKNKKESFLIIIAQRMNQDAISQMRKEGFPYVITRQNLDGVLLDYAPIR